MNKRDLLEYEEGFSPRPFYDTEGYPTVGYGFKIAGQGAALPTFLLPKVAADAWLSALIIELEDKMRHSIIKLNEPRKAVIISMCYQLGVIGCLGFRKMWIAIRAEDWEAARLEMLDSKWARQTPARALRHAAVMRSGDFKGIY